MARKQLTIPGEIVKKSNALARARWNAESVWEPRLVALLASKVGVEDKDFQVYEIPVSEVMKEKKIKGGKDYKEIETVVDKVMSRVLTIRDEKGHGWTKYNVFSRCRYRPDEGILELGFHPDLRPHYLNLKTNFAQYNLMEFLLLPSIYSQRLFEFLKSWEDKPDTTVSLIYLHEMLNAPQISRKNFAEFRRRVLDKAHKDILKNTTLYYEWEPIKKGTGKTSPVVEIRFIFSKKRALPVAEKKIDYAKEQESQKNNKLALKAFNCANEKNKICLEQNNKKNVCEVCKRMSFATYQTSLV